MLVFLILLIPSTLLAFEPIKTGYDLYRAIKLMDNPKNSDEIVQGMYAKGYLLGYLDGLTLMRDAIFEMMFPDKPLSEKEIGKLSKESNFNYLNFPKYPLPFGQVILMYKKFAEKHPEKLNETVRLCVFLSLVEEYGWK